MLRHCFALLHSCNIATLCCAKHVVAAATTTTETATRTAKKATGLLRLAKQQLYTYIMNFLYISLPFLHDYGVKMGDVNNPCTTNFAPSYGARGEEISPKKRLTLRIFIGCHAFVGEERCVTTKSVRKHNKMTQFQCQPNIFSFPLKNIKNQNNSSRQTKKQTSCSLEFYGQVKVQLTSNRDVTDR